MSATAAPASARRHPTWVVVVVAGLAGLFYAFIVWSAVALLVQQASGEFGLNGLGWFVHFLPIVFPILAFGVAFAVGYRRPLWQFALVMVTGLTVSAAFWIDVFAYAITSFSLYGG